jgi:hypothetical protein
MMPMPNAIRACLTIALCAIAGTSCNKDADDSNAGATALSKGASYTCSGREAQEARGAVAELQWDAKNLLEQHPDLQSTEALLKARITGSNGWPALQAACDLFENAQRGSADGADIADWSFVSAEYFDRWLDEQPERADLLPGILDQMLPALAKLREALKAGCIVLPYPRASSLAGFAFREMFWLREAIHRKLKRFEALREDARLFQQLAWKLDGLGLPDVAMIGALRRAAAEMIISLAMVDPGSKPLIDEALATNHVPLPGFRESWQVETAYALSIALREPNEKSDEDDPTWVFSKAESVERLSIVLRGMVQMHIELKGRDLDLRSVDDAKQHAGLVDKCFAALPAEGWVYSRQMFQRFPMYTVASRFNTDASILLLEFARLADDKWSLSGRVAEAHALVEKRPGLLLVGGVDGVAIKPLPEHPFAIESTDWMVRFPPKSS